MPIYAFECTQCGHQFERLQRLADADPTQCPECHAEQIRRRLTAPSFRLAGSGWYETDFKKDSDKQRNLVDKKDSGAEAPSAAASQKPESKPDLKPEIKANQGQPPSAGASIPAAVKPRSGQATKAEPVAPPPKVDRPASKD